MKLAAYSLMLLFLISACSYKKAKTNENFNEPLLEDYNGKLSNGTIKRIADFPSKFIQPRNVDIWLPNNYNKKNKYAVLYMHDGQMLFDAETTWNKQEWKVDEVASNLMDQGKVKDFIVVAIWNISEIRHTDYYPQKPFDLLPQKFKDSIFETGKKQYGSNFKGLNSDNYLKFIVEELKPFIDSNFSVFNNLENTFISGSSMGGLISMYALCEYPEIFGGAACLSTHWIGFAPQENSPVPQSFFNYMNENLPSSKTHKIYFDYGTQTLDEFYLPYQHYVNEILKNKGFDNTNSANIKFEGHDHSENSWNKRLDIPITFLLKK